MLSKKQISLQKITKKVSPKASFLGVHISQNAAAATDGIVMAEIINKKPAQIPFGAIFPKGEMTLNLTGVKAGAKAPKLTSDMPDMDNVFFAKEDAETATLFATDKTNKRIYEITKIDDEFPDYSSLMDEAIKQPIRGIVAGDELIKVANILKDYRNIKIMVSDDSNNVFFLGEDNESAAKIILMKIKE